MAPMMRAGKVASAGLIIASVAKRDAVSNTIGNATSYGLAELRNVSGLQFGRLLIGGAVLQVARAE